MNPWDESDAFEAAARPAAPEAAVALSQRAMAARPMPWLDGLNPAQRAAVEALDGPVLMLAGAGTGKTRALTARIAHLLTLGRARPNEILAVTFTNKAAREMKDRVIRMLGPAAEGMPWMGTFHSLSVKILRRHAELAGLRPNFTILDTDDQVRLLKQLIAARNIDDKRWPARMLAGLIDQWKNRAWTPAQVPSSEAGAYNNLGTEIYAEYQARLRSLNAVDFGDLLLHCVTIFKAHPDVLAQYQRWFRYILVDEYQDTNIAQYLWLRLLAQAHHNICCVGDDDQSIYGWRGAEVGNILRFEKDFPGAQVIRLEQNYRSTPHILGAASGVIAANSGRLGKTLWTEIEEGERVRLIGHWDGEEEARWIGEEIEALQRGTRGLDPVGLNDQAILVRASHQMRAFEDRFLTIGLPYRVIGGPRFYERAEIRDAMAYFRLAVSPADDLAFERIVNTPRRGLGDKAVQAIQVEARRLGISLVEGARALLAQGGIAGRGGAQLRGFLESLDRWGTAIHGAPAAPRDQLIEPFLPETPAATDLSHVRLAETILEESGYVSMWQNDKSPDAPGRLDNLKELVKALEQFDSLQGFLEHVSLIMENDSEDATEKVSIMTLHAAKGLEFPAVFLPGWEDGLFPSQRAMDEGGQKAIEEERRLAYVGLTRPERICTVSFASNRRVYGQWQSQLPSRFIDEMPVAHVEVLTLPGLHGGGYGAAAPGFGLGAGSGRSVSDVEARATSADVYNSPGWRRLQERQKQPPATRPRSPGVTIDATRVEPGAGGEGGYAIGDRVFHVKFGYGAVTGVEGDKLDIRFDKAGEKKIIARFVMPADLGGELEGGSAPRPGGDSEVPF
ncbi:ATP-dependent helicase [Pseudogemmobacter sonorensis]|uniref:ATP-dependent helicase n=1 Tax=Pseudogemmobacter sonorensis TaxID=2989681 RepID=UPI003684D481